MRSDYLTLAMRRKRMPPERASRRAQNMGAAAGRLHGTMQFDKIGFSNVLNFWVTNQNVELLDGLSRLFV